MTAHDERAYSEEIERLRSLTCFKWTHFPDDVLPAWVADMDFPPAPAITEVLRALVDRGDFGYNGAAASQLTTAFAGWQERRHGWRPSTDRSRVFCDVMQAVETALWAHTEPGDGVVVFTPVYPPFLSSVTSNRRRLVDCPLDPDGWRLDAERLEAAVDGGTTAVLLCNPHNPTGRVFTRDELEAISRVAEANDLLVISDEIWADLLHPGARHVPFASLSEAAAARTVTVSAASKAFSVAGLRCAVAHIGHAGVAEAIAALPSHLLGAVGTPGAEATLAAWTLGEPWLDETAAFLTTQRDHVAARLAAEAPGVRMQLPEATYLAWLDMRELDLPEDPAAYVFQEARVALSGGTDFGPHGEGFVRLNFATTRPILDRILDRIVAALAKAQPAR